MDNDQNQNINNDAKGGEAVMHTLQDDLDSLGIKSMGGAAVASKTTPVATAPAKDDKTTSGDDSERNKEVPKSASPFLTNAPASDSVAKPETKTFERKKEKEKPADEKTGFFGLGRFFKKTEEKKEAPQKLPVTVIEPTRKEAFYKEEPRKPLLAPKPVQKEASQNEEAKKAFFAQQPVQKPTFQKEEPKRTFFAPPKLVQREEDKKGEVRKQLFASPRPAQEEASQKEELRKPLFSPKPTQKEVLSESQPVVRVVARAIATEKPTENIAEKETDSAGGMFGIFKKGNVEKSAEEIQELKNNRAILEQKNKELDQARLSLEEKVKQYTSELKEIKENEEKIAQHTQELKKNETSLDRQVIEKNQLLKEKLKQLEEFQAQTKEREVKMLNLKTQIEKLEEEVLSRELKIKEAQKQTGLFGMIRKMRNRKLIETGENLRKIHYALEKKNKELKQTKESLEEEVRKQVRELKDIKENEEKAKRHLDELKKNEIIANQQVTEKSNELKEKFELLKANLERQVVEKNSALKEKLEKLAEINTVMVERERKIAASKEKIEGVEKEIAAKRASADEIMKKAETEIAAKKASAQDILKKAEQEAASKEAMAKAKLEGLEKEIATKRASADEVMQKTEKEIAAKEAMAKAKLTELEKEVATKESMAKAKLAELEKEVLGQKARTKNAPSGAGLFGLFSNKNKKMEEKTTKTAVPEGLPVKAGSPFEVKNKTEVSPGVKGASQIPNVQPRREEQNQKEEKAIQPAIQIKKPQWGKVFATTIIMVIIVAICAGSYIFLTTRSNSISIQTESKPVVELPIVEVTQSAFSADKPNYLNIDVESTSPLKITQLLVSTSIEIKEAQIDTPVEFLVTDANNNPLAFSVFANLFGLNISANVLSSFEEGFSIYIYTDKGNARAALAVDLKNKEVAVSELLKEEAGINNSLMPLFLGEAVEQGAIVFKDGQYKGLAVRYANLNNQSTVSLDYTFLDGQLVIGTSKDTLRAVVDKIGVAEIKNGD